METDLAAAPAAERASLRPLAERDLPTADRIFRLAFGTFVGLPDPLQFYAGADYVRTRWRTDPSRAFVAEVDGQVVGSNFATNWGSVGFFGPLTVHPDLWGAGIGKRLMEPIMERFAVWGTRLAGLFTFPHSPRHLSLYQRFGFHPQSLTPILAKPVSAVPRPEEASEFSSLSAADKAATLKEAAALSNRCHDGLDLTSEIIGTRNEGLGDTVLLRDGSALAGFAVCQLGSGTEAGPDTCYVKIGLVGGGAGAARRFERLLDACEALAATRGLTRLLAGANTARHETYRCLLARGFAIELIGVAMTRPNEPGYNRPGIFLLDDWR